MSMWSTPRRRKGSLDTGLDVLGTAGQPGLLAVVVECEPELGGDDDLVADRRQGCTDDLFVAERPVDLGGVEEGDSCVDGLPEKGDAFLPDGYRQVALAQAHSAVADGRDPQALAECSGVHGVLLC